MRSPAPPLISLLGLLGMLIGEAGVNYFRGHPQVFSWICHAKTFYCTSAHASKAVAAAAARDVIE